MARIEIAYLLIAAILIIAAFCVVTTWRYLSSQRRIRRGSRTAPAVWKPFWMS